MQVEKRCARLRRRTFKRGYLAALLVIPALLSAGSSVVKAEDDLAELLEFNYEEATTSEDVMVSDPLESLNRGIFVFNDKTYIWVIDPIATAYRDIVAEDIRGCLSDFFYNIAEPIRCANAMLQGRFADSGRIISRFLLNSTLGVYGFADVATTEFDLPPVKATLGETLAQWGVGEGCYLVVPFKGPSTVRDFAGDTIDSFGTSPYWYWSDYDYSRDWPTMMGVYSTREINRVSFKLGEYEKLKQLTLDPYIAIRNAYYQRRDTAEIKGN